jgi:hypothetical protein
MRPTEPLASSTRPDTATPAPTPLPSSLTVSSKTQYPLDRTVRSQSGFNNRVCASILTARRAMRGLGVSAMQNLSNGSSKISWGGFGARDAVQGPGDNSRELRGGKVIPTTSNFLVPVAAFRIEGGLAGSSVERGLTLGCWELWGRWTLGEVEKVAGDRRADEHPNPIPTRL